MLIERGHVSIWVRIVAILLAFAFGGGLLLFGIGGGVGIFDSGGGSGIIGGSGSSAANDEVKGLEKDVAQDPGNLDLRSQLSDAYFGASKSAEGIDELNQIAQMQPTNAQAWADLAEAQDRFALLDQAGQSYRRAVQLDPKNTDTLIAYGALAQELGQTDVAREQYTAARGQLEPGTTDFKQVNAALSALTTQALGGKQGQPLLPAGAPSQVPGAPPTGAGGVLPPTDGTPTP